MTYVYASRMGKTEKLIEKLAIDAMKIENGTETVKGRSEEHTSELQSQR